MKVTTIFLPDEFSGTKSSIDDAIRRDQNKGTFQVHATFDETTETHVWVIYGDVGDIESRLTMVAVSWDLAMKNHTPKNQLPPVFELFN